MLEIGSVIDNKYKIIYQVGKGGTSRVFLALNEAANREWAVKEIPKTAKRGGREIKQRPMAETSIMKKLRHDNIAEIADVLETDDAYLIIMDYIEGKTLKEILREEGAQPQELVVEWAISICGIFSYLHSQDPKIIYRDLKPGNLMLQPDGKIMLIDFGAAREFKGGEPGDTDCLGTRGYAAPEQYPDPDGGTGNSDERTDIYNLGATMYHLVTGRDPSRPPYEIRPIRQWDRSLSSGLEEIIIRCTKNNPDERYQTAEDLAYALRHYREMENEYKAEKKRQWHFFIASCAASVLSLVLAVGMRVYAGRLLDSTYGELLRKGQTATQKELRIQAYEDAVKADPSRGEAYSGLLNDVFLEDGEFEQQETEKMTQVLGYRGPGWNRTAEESFRSSKKDYDRFCYDMGLALFYYYGSDGSKQLSRPWFETAKDSGTLDETKRLRAERFYRIADYYSRLGDKNRSGDAVVSYSEYWSDLLALCRGDIVQQDNLRTALVMYRELAYQIGSHAGEFRNAGVSKQEMQSQLSRIRREVEYYEKNAEESDLRLMGEITENVDAAEKILAVAFAE